jgi:hypothetical protein
MLVFGLIHDGGWEPSRREPPEDPRTPPPGRSWHLPWRPLAWVAAWCWLMALVPVASDDIGPLAGYVVVMAAVALAFWRINRWCARQYWSGLRDFKL